MYAWFWRRLPGPIPVRLGLAFLTAGTVIALLLFVVFPGLEPLLPFHDVTVPGP